MLIFLAPVVKLPKHWDFVLEAPAIRLLAIMMYQDAITIHARIVCMVVSLILGDWEHRQT